MAEILHFKILRKHGQTHRQTDRHGHYNTSPSPYGGRGNNRYLTNIHDGITQLTSNHAVTDRRISSLSQLQHDLTKKQDDMAKSSTRHRQKTRTIE